MPPKARPKKSLSGIKRVRQARKQNLSNKGVISKIKTLTKKLHSAVDSKDANAVTGCLKAAVTALSSAASKGVIPKNTASRKISRLSKLANSALKSQAA